MEAIMLTKSRWDALGALEEATALLASRETGKCGVTECIWNCMDLDGKQYHIFFEFRSINVMCVTNPLFCGMATK